MRGTQNPKLEIRNKFKSLKDKKHKAPDIENEKKLDKYLLGEVSRE